MNHIIEKFARAQLLDGVMKLPIENQRIFKLMYGRDKGKRSVEDTLSMTIEAVVETMCTDQLDWAMMQVERTKV